MKKSVYTRLKLLEKHSSHLIKMAKNGRFKSLSSHKRKKWVRRITNLQHQLGFYQRIKGVKKVIAQSALAVSLAVGAATNATAQPIFGTPQNNPFGLTGSSYFSMPVLGDLDNDGDLDIIEGGANDTTNIFYHENMGTSSTPTFGTKLNAPFGLQSGYYFAMPTLADIDNDGDLDLFYAEYNGNIQYFENTGTATAPTFTTPLTNPFGITSGYYFAKMTFGDIDNDGDLDLFYGEYYGNIQYFENTGTATAPTFAAPLVNPFGLVATYNAAMPDLVDIDGDGDLDLFVAEYYGNMQYFENIGTNTAPNFASPILNPFGINTNNGSSDYVIPDFVDIDNDGDLDLIVGIYDYANGGGFIYQENLGSNVAPTSADTTILINQDEIYTFSPMDFPFSDSNGQTIDSLRIINLPNAGGIVYSGVLSISPGIFPVSDIPLLTYLPPSGQFGNSIAQFQFEVNDGSLWNGTPRTFTFNINGKPSVTDSSIDIERNNSHTFTTTDFNYTDPEGNGLSKIQITKLVDKGMLQLNGTDVTLNQEIDVADFPNLVFTPETDSLGNPYTDFEYLAYDGMIYSDSAAKVMITVNPPVSTEGLKKDLTTFKVFPNPATRQFSVRLIATEPSKRLHLQVINAIGQEIYQEEIPPYSMSDVSIQTADWAKGIYFVRVTVNENYYVEKIMIK